MILAKLFFKLIYYYFFFHETDLISVLSLCTFLSSWDMQFIFFCWKLEMFEVDFWCFAYVIVECLLICVIFLLDRVNGNLTFVSTFLTCSWPLWRAKWWQTPQQCTGLTENPKVTSTAQNKLAPRVYMSFQAGSQKNSFLQKALRAAESERDRCLLDSCKKTC